MITEHDEYFWSLVRPAKEAHKKPCLRCHRPMTDFKMKNRGNRICVECHRIINKLGALCQR